MSLLSLFQDLSELEHSRVHRLLYHLGLDYASYTLAYARVILNRVYVPVSSALLVLSHFKCE